MGERANERDEGRSDERNEKKKYRSEGSPGETSEHRSPDDRGAGGEHDLEETLDRERHGSGEFDPEERYGRYDTTPDRKHAGPGDEDEPDTAEEEPKRGRSPRKQNPTRRRDR